MVHIQELDGDSAQVVGWRGEDTEKVGKKGYVSEPAMHARREQHTSGCPRSRARSRRQPRLRQMPPPQPWARSRRCAGGMFETPARTSIACAWLSRWRRRAACARRHGRRAALAGRVGAPRSERAGAINLNNPSTPTRAFWILCLLSLKC